MDQSEGSEFLNASADVNGGHTCCVAEINLPHWKLKRMAFAKSRPMQASQHFANQVRNARDARLLTNGQYPFTAHGCFDDRSARERRGNSRVFFAEGLQSFMRNEGYPARRE